MSAKIEICASTDFCVVLPRRRESIAAPRDARSLVEKCEAIDRAIAGYAFDWRERAEWCDERVQCHVMECALQLVAQQCTEGLA